MMDFLIADTAVFGKRQREREPELDTELNVAAAIIGSAVVGGAMSASAASDAADAQSGAAADANALQKYIFDEQVKLQQPWRDAGVGGLNRLSYMLGLSPTGYGGTAGGNGMPTMETPEQIRARLVQRFTTQSTSNLPGGYTSAEEGGGVTPGAPVTNSVVDEARLSQAIQREQARQKQAYERAANKAERVAGRDPEYGSLMDTFDLKDFQVDPGYAFRQSQGEKALQRAASLGGGIDSGAMLKDAMDFNQGLASQEFGNAYNRFNNNQDKQFNRLASISGIGQTASNNISNAAQNYGNQAGGNIIGAGNAQAAGRVGSANAWNNAIGQGVSMYQQNQLMNSYGGGTPSYYGNLGGGAGNYNYGGGF
jgi:hypothetical protein